MKQKANFMNTEMQIIELTDYLKNIHFLFFSS